MLNKDLFRKGEKIAVALSGGKDSMCLLDLLIRYKDELGITLCAINVDHGIRGEESIQDSAFVKSYCESNNIPLLSCKVDCPSYCSQNKIGLEEGARKLRYDVFFEAISNGFCDRVATAHHMSDNVETILFNLFRGCSLSGASGIESIAYNDRIIRPLLYATREEICNYIEKYSIPFVEDKTNADSLYSRNYIRNEILPLVKNRFPEAERALSRFSELANRDDKYLEFLAEKLIDESGDEIHISYGYISVFSRACVMAIKRMGIAKDFEKVHVDRLVKLVNDESGTQIDLMKGVKAVKDYKYITLYRIKESLNKPQNIPLYDVITKEIFSELNFCDVNYIFERTNETIKKIKGTNYFDLEKIPKTAVFRTRQEGDVFTSFGGTTKKLKEYFIDKKIPARYRDNILLLADGNEILLICGVEISDRIRVDKTTKDVIKCYSKA